MSDLVLVERFEELTPGVRARYDCQCVEGARHDVIVTGAARVASVVYLDGARGMMRVVPVAPQSSCAPPSRYGHGIGEAQVWQRRVYRFVDFEPQQVEEKAARTEVLAAAVHAPRKKDTVE